jgi:hypothetical protein
VLITSRSPATSSRISYFADPLTEDGIEIVERWDEPGYVSLKCRDPTATSSRPFWEPAR